MAFWIKSADNLYFNVKLIDNRQKLQNVNWLQELNNSKNG